MACQHPYCTKQTKGHWCGRHWHDLTDDLRRRIRRAKTVEEKGALLVEARTWFEQERMIGRHEISSCRGRYPDYAGCSADIVWLKTRQDKNMPVDADSVEADDDYYEHGKHVPHWATCPKAESFKR